MGLLASATPNVPAKWATGAGIITLAGFGTNIANNVNDQANQAATDIRHEQQRQLSLFDRDQEIMRQQAATHRSRVMDLVGSKRMTFKEATKHVAANVPTHHKSGQPAQAWDGGKHRGVKLSHSVRKVHGPGRWEQAKKRWDANNPGGSHDDRLRERDAKTPHEHELAIMQAKHDNNHEQLWINQGLAADGHRTRVGFPMPAESHYSDPRKDTLQGPHNPGVHIRGMGGRRGSGSVREVPQADAPGPGHERGSAPAGAHGSRAERAPAAAARPHSRSAQDPTASSRPRSGTAAGGPSEHKEGQHPSSPGQMEEGTWRAARDNRQSRNVPDHQGSEPTPQVSPRSVRTLGMITKARSVPGELSSLSVVQQQTPPSSSNFGRQPSASGTSFAAPPAETRRRKSSTSNHASSAKGPHAELGHRSDVESESSQSPVGSTISVNSRRGGRGIEPSTARSNLAVIALTPTGNLAVPGTSPRSEVRYRASTVASRGSASSTGHRKSRDQHSSGSGSTHGGSSPHRESATATSGHTLRSGSTKPSGIPTPSEDRHRSSPGSSQDAASSGTRRSAREANPSRSGTATAQGSSSRSDNTPLQGSATPRSGSTRVAVNTPTPGTPNPGTPSANLPRPGAARTLGTGTSQQFSSPSQPRTIGGMMGGRFARAMATGLTRSGAGSRSPIHPGK